MNSTEVRAKRRCVQSHHMMVTISLASQNTEEHTMSVQYMKDLVAYFMKLYQLVVTTARVIWRAIKLSSFRLEPV